MKRCKVKINKIKNILSGFYKYQNTLFYSKSIISYSKKGVQNGFYTARYGLKGCHWAVRAVPATQNREKAVPQARNSIKEYKKWQKFINK